jgi:Tol biopolymer transport system component
MNRWVTTAMIALFALASMTVRARQESAGPARSQNPRELFERARLLEETSQNLNDAIALYGQVVAQAKSDRALAAAAQLRMGMSYEKLGKPEASKTYDVVVHDYADQTSVATQARMRMAALAPVKKQADGLSPRRVMTIDSSMPSSISDISADGSLAVGRHTSIEGNTDLVLTNTSTGQMTVLAKGSSSEVGLGFGLDGGGLSRDARQVAYTWSEWIRTAAAPMQRRVSLRIIGRKPGATPQTVLSLDGVVISPMAWSTDGKAIIAVTSTAATVGPRAWTVVTVSIANGAIRTIKVLPSPQARLTARLSPDGRFLAYASPVSPGSTDRHIYSIDLGGQNETDVVKMAGANGQPIWTPDGNHLIFVNTRSGVSGLWAVPVQGGKPSGEPSFLQQKQANAVDNPIGMSLSGVLYYEQENSPGSMVHVVERPLSSRVVQQFPGMRPAWSPDAKSIAFYRQAPGGSDVIVRSLDNGDEKLYQHAGILSYVSPRWLHDSTGFLVLITEPKGMPGPAASFYSVDAKTGMFTRVLAKDTDDHPRSGVVALSPDDKTLYMIVMNGPGGRATSSTGIVGVNLKSGDETPILTFPRTGLPGEVGLAVSPNGATLALMTETRLMTVGIDGSGYRELYGPFESGGFPDHVRWTPDGQALVFVTDPTPNAQQVNWQVMRIPSRGGQPQLDGLESTKLSGWMPPPRLSGIPTNGIPTIDLSPDGSRIVFGVSTQPTYELWALQNVMAVLSKR